ncbi:hypothetical protein NQ317_008983 [Molorchus minor]|uniref:Cytochrome c oxidase polypeptide VIIc n=1 Tax=Molorchus minor TaxID=1323400 RepID=A0ABQ9J8M3_9CUCU|nr:hypothetical protein NQ317_008983 [Molorchus minor]
MVPAEPEQGIPIPKDRIPIPKEQVRFHYNIPMSPSLNLPFSINNRYKLTAYFILYFGSGFGAPFLVLRHQLLKKSISHNIVNLSNMQLCVYFHKIKKNI